MAQQPQPLQFAHCALDRIASGARRPAHLDFGSAGARADDAMVQGSPRAGCVERNRRRSEEHTSELQSLIRISYAVFCLKKKTQHAQKSTNLTANQDLTISYNATQSTK